MFRIVFGVNFVIYVLSQLVPDHNGVLHTHVYLLSPLIQPLPSPPPVLGMTESALFNVSSWHGLVAHSSISEKHQILDNEVEN